MWQLDCEESWVLKNWYFWTVVLEKTPKSPLDCKEIQPVHSKGDQPWVFIGRTDAKAETPVLWPPHAKSWLIGKDRDAERDWGQEEKGTTEDEMAEWHHQLNGREFEWTPGVGDGQEGLACCNSWGRKESDTTERLNWTDWHGWCSYRTHLPVQETQDAGFDLWVSKISWRREWLPLQYFCLENSVDRRAWRATVHGVAKTPQLSTDTTAQLSTTHTGVRNLRSEG